MRTSKTYTMNGKTFKSMSEIARELNVSRIRPTDFSKYGIVEMLPTDENAKADVVETVDVVVEDEAKVEESTEVESKKEEPVQNNAEDSVEENSEDLSKDTENLSKDQLNAQLKELSLEELTKMAKELKANTYEGIENKGIRRMRLIMGIREVYFPTPKSNGEPTVWKPYSVEELKEVANKNDVKYKPCDDLKILKMRIIMALKSANIQPEVNNA